MERKFLVVKMKCGTLEKISQHEVTARSVDAARAIGETRHGQRGYFVGAQSI